MKCRKCGAEFTLKKDIIALSKCPNCGEENRDGLKVCLHCGSDLVKPEPEPSRPGKGGLPPEPKKSGHKLRNGVIILVILLILFFIGSAIAPNFLATDSSTVNSIQSSDSLMSIGDDSSSQSSDNSQLFSKDNDDSSSNNGNSFLSTKTENFDGFFTMDVDGNLTFVENNNSDYGADRPPHIGARKDLENTNHPARIRWQHHRQPSE